MDIKIENLPALHLLWLVPALLIVFAYGFWRKRQALQRFASTNLLAGLLPDVSGGRQKAKALLVLLAVGALVLALVDPRWGVHYEELHHRGIDTIFVLDVSRSMLARDVSPSRLERAKQYVRDAVEVLRGDRVGLITFAGTAVMKCPLTVDYGAFRMVLDEVGIQSSNRGGSLIGDAIRFAADSFADKLKKYKAIVLITDGEDHESYPVEAAATAYTEKGIRIYTIGIGDLAQGGRIPIEKNGQQVYLQYEGQEVWSKLDTRSLMEMAAAGGGRYIAAGTIQVDMGEVYQQVIASDDLRELGTTQAKRYDVQFQWFAGLAFVLLMIETMLTDRKPKRLTQPA